MGGDQSGGLLGKTVKFVSGVLWTKGKDSAVVSDSSNLKREGQGKTRKQ